MNMRKIIAVLAAALMLCSVIPMGALSVAADGAFDFEDGTVGGWLSGCNIEVVDDNGNKVLKWDASGADWANVYYYGSAMVSANTDYVVSFRVKADRNTNINFKVNNNWAGDTAAKTFDVSTEWQEYSEVINSGACTSGALLLFSSNTTAANGATYYLDDISFVEYVEPVAPGTVSNGDFETGDLSGWEHHQSTAISTDAHSGSYAANLKGDGGWGGMLNQDVPVEAGKTYHISIWAKAIANGANVQIKDGGTSGANLASQWFTATEWTELTWDVIPTTDVICFNFCGGGNGIAEDVLVDDITVTELKDPSDDGFIKNGDFEIGEGTPWTLYSGSVVDAVAAKDGDYGLYVKNPTGGWGGTAFQDFTVEVGKTYVVTMDAKAIANGQNIQIQNPIGTTVGSKWFKDTSWTALSFEFTATDAASRINICGGGTGGNEEIYVDNVVVSEKVVDPDQPNEIWSVDFNDGDKKFNVGEVVTEGPDGSNCYKWDFAGGWGSNYTSGPYMDFTKDYSVTMKVKGSIDSTMAITLMPSNWSTWWNGPSFNVTTEWKEVILHIPANTVSFASGNILFEFQGTGSEPAYTLYVDDIVIVEGLVELPEPDNYLVNGDLETGDTAPWNNLWGSCPTMEIVEGMDGGYGLHIVSGKWNHVRQTNIAVKANTWYKVTLWAKNTNNMCVLVKSGDDSADIINKPVTAGDEWTEFTIEFNTGDYTSIIFSLMGGEGEEQQEGTFDNILMEKAPCQHEYEITDGSFPTCDTDGATIYTCSCGASYTEEIPAYHNGNLEYSAAVDPIDCATPGHIEYYYCPGCNEYFADANATEMINPWYINVTVDCVKPEGLADCADWTCEVCGNENYGSGEHDTGVPACQDGHCSKCDKDIAGYGHQNYDGPACLPGNCYYCGEAMEPVAHENGAWAPCLEGECAYGCGLTYPATAEHVDDDANGYCDTCWSVMPHDCIDEDGNYECDICYSTMPHDCIDEDGDLHCDICWGVMPHDCIDEDGDNWCDICWNPMPEEPPVVEIIYGDADGDGEITLLDANLLNQYLSDWDVTLDEAAADADGDGEITLLDANLLNQYLSDWDVTLGPV